MHGAVEASGGAGAPAAASRVIDPGTAVGTVSLTVSDLPRVRSFYERVLGLTVLRDDGGRVVLGAPSGLPLIELQGDGSAPARDPRSPGLFHLAILFPDRRALAMALARVAGQGWPLSGASDHLVSEALYLSDPEGNGIELYRDRPRDEWQVRDGQLAMATLPLDVENLLAELARDSQVEPQAPSAATMGHVHLQVSDVRQAEQFYAGVLGFEVTVRGYPGALFVSAGGYHHHLGLNTWNSPGSPPAPAGVTGLRSFRVVLPDQDALDSVLERIAEAGLTVETDATGHLVRDPFGNAVLLTTA
jgi:catechol 2,3-dioxygenase